MAWMSSGSTSAELISNMAKHGLIRSARLTEAMKKVDRANYVLDKADAYEDSPQPIGYEATISAPHMHAHAIENLIDFLLPGAKVLDVGSGSGYLCAVLHHLVGPTGKVVGIDHIPELVEWSVENLKNDGLTSTLDDKSIEMITGDGRQGWLEKAPFDAIHVGAAAPMMPRALVDQLAKPGRMFIPVGTHTQSIFQVDKDRDGNVTEKKLFGVRYVPLTDRKT
ncbi:hypothetical protein QCA50_015498 [Cerrena zonata]|uniref:Protein-L-isoaspartate O-methyltransferase n=1 Tax=Cerrena zonata TaxID=2478898 RepID=A0AAW0FVN9_9APHY